MGRRKDERARVLGPTWVVSRERYRVTVITPQAGGPDGRETTRWFTDQTEAQDFADAIASKLARFSTTTIGEAIKQYQNNLHEQGTLPVSYKEVIRRLRAFFPDHDIAIHRVTADRAKGLYAAFKKRLKPDGDPISVDYHRAALINARSFCKFCVAEGWLSANPFGEVEGTGRRSSGKPQLTGDEIRQLYAYCLARARDGDAAALGVLMALLMALRSSDITRRVVRDLDLDGTVLRVSAGKTRKSNRPRNIPVVLRPLLATLADGRSGDEALFITPYTDNGHHTRRWLEQAMDRFCAAAGVPRVPPHSLKGAAGTLAAEMGDTADRIADHLSHESKATTERHYVAPGALDDAQLERAFKVIAGGKRR